MKSKELYPETTKKMSEKKAALTLGIAAAFKDFSKSVFKEVALSEKTKQLIAKALAHITQCPYTFGSVPNKPCEKKEAKKNP